MAKKKVQGKKHKFKHTSSNDSSASTVDVSSVNEVSSSVQTAQPSAPVARRPDVRRGNVQPAAFVRDFSYVGQDLRRIAVFAGSLIALELVLWFVFAHTGVGPAVYKLVQV